MRMLERCHIAVFWFQVSGFSYGKIHLIQTDMA
jgi:hypothetical protein